MGLTATMNTMSEWSEQLVSRFGASMRARRKELGLTVQDVSDRTTQAGHPLSRTAITDYELGRRKDRLMLGDALALAEALRTPLGSLLYPEQPDGEVEAYPGVTLDSHTAAHTLTGVEIPVPETHHLPDADITPDENLRAQEWNAGSILPGEAEVLVRMRESLFATEANFRANIEAGNIDSAEHYQKLISELRTRIDRKASEVRELGGVVNDG